MNGVKRIVNGNTTDAHKVLISAGKLHGRGHSTWPWKGGGIIFPVDHPVYDEMDKAFDRVVAEYGDKGMIPIVEENGIYNFYLGLDEEESSEGQVAGAEENVPASEELKIKPKASDGGAQHGLGAGG